VPVIAEIEASQMLAAEDGVMSSHIGFDGKMADTRAEDLPPSFATSSGTLFENYRVMRGWLNRGIF